MNTNDQGAEAIHLSNGENQHIVGVKSIRVFISKDGDMWFAQGLDIDYASCGNTIAETKMNFETGIKKTIAEHLKLHGDIEKFLKTAPQEAWKEYFETSANIIKQEFSDLQFHDLCDEMSEKESCFPFNKIEFLAEQLAA